ncbi:MAG: TlpA family protein disulfide reductase [Chloroflexi bacterium]|nr:TlpA family protein disulfide reductase [Chloroflexota bacterium]
MQALYEKYGEKGAVVIGISSEDNAASVAEFMKKEGLSFPVLLDPNSKVFDQYGINAHPAHYFIDKSGRISDFRIGYTDGPTLTAKLEKAFE